MIALEDKYNLLENASTSNNMYLIQKRESKLSIILRYIKNLFMRNPFVQIDTEKSEN